MLIESNELVRKPMVSVIIITYNQEKYINQTIESVIDQTCDFDYEIIIGEDCGTDKTRDICIDYQKRYPRKIKLLLQETNQGLIQNYLSTISLCNGKYIAQCAGDDYWIDPLKLHKQVKFLEENNDYGLVYTNINTYYQENKRLIPGKYNEFKELTFERQLITAGFYAPMTWMFRSSHVQLVKSYPDTYSDESLALLLDILHKSKVFYMDEITAVYRVTTGTLARQLDDKKRYIYELGVFQIQKDYILKYDVSNPKIIDYIYSDNYLRILPLALICKDQSFIEAAKTYFTNKNIAFETLKVLCQQNIEMEQQNKFMNISRAYRLGKFILKPFSSLRKVSSKFL